MGTIRLLLAASVVLSHYHLDGHRWSQLVGATLAVQAFFVVSGFYMGLVLDTKYPTAAGWAGCRRFWLSRFLRIYPTYAIIGLAVIAAGVLAGNPLRPGPYWAIANVTIVGQEIAFWPGMDGVPKLVNPPSWSLSLELVFYALVPFLWRMRTSALIGIAASSLALYLALYYCLDGAARDAWTFRFLPSELGFFVCGLLTYRRYRSGIDVSAAVRVAVSAPILVVVFGYVPHAYPWRDLAFLAGLCWALPLLFAASRMSALDRFIGDLSYPIYLVHGPMFFAVQMLVSGRGVSLVAIVPTILASILLVVLVDRPMDAVRARLGSRLGARLPIPVPS